MPTYTVPASVVEDELNDNLEVRISSIQFYRNNTPDIEFEIENVKDIDIDIEEAEVLELMADCHFNEIHLEELSDHVTSMVKGYPEIARAMVQELIVDMDDATLAQIYDSIQFRVPKVESVSFWNKLFKR